MPALRGEAYFLELWDEGRWRPFAFLVGDALQIRTRGTELGIVLRQMQSDCLTPLAGRVRRYPVAEG